MLTAYATHESTTVAHAGGVRRPPCTSHQALHAATESYGVALGGSWSMAIASTVLMPSMHNPDHAGMKGRAAAGSWRRHRGWQRRRAAQVDVPS